MKKIGFYKQTLTLLQALLVLCTSTVQAQDSATTEDNRWQQRRLFEPTASERLAEAKGRVVIYDGLQDVEVAQAMDQEFERVDSMMFIRTQITDDTGTVVDSEDEGCD